MPPKTELEEKIEQHLKLVEYFEEIRKQIHELETEIVDLSPFKVGQKWESALAIINDKKEKK